MRFFTVEEANRFVPALEQAFGRIEQHRRELVRIAIELEAMGHGLDLEAPEVPEDGPAQVRGRALQARKLAEEIRGVVGELQSHGVLVKRLDGLVDFRSRRGNRSVLLCWRKGESQVSHWHELESGFTGRLPLDNRFAKAALPN